MAKKWYIIHTYSGFERKVAESLMNLVQAKSLEDKIGQILIPTEDVVEMRSGKRVVSSKLFYPGYILIEMEMDNDTWYQVRHTPKVTGFVSSGKDPIPLTDEEVENIVNRVSATTEAPKPKFIFEAGDSVRIVDGPFKDFSGRVEDVNLERSTVKVNLTILGRPTPVELEFIQIEKV